jgi:hypothetical protein
MVMKVERTSGTLKTHGDQLGEIKDISRFKEAQTCVQLLNAMPIHLLIAQEHD